MEDNEGNFIHVGYDFYFYLGSKNHDIAKISFPNGINCAVLDKSPSV